MARKGELPKPKKSDEKEPEVVSSSGADPDVESEPEVPEVVKAADLVVASPLPAGKDGVTYQRDGDRVIENKTFPRTDRTIVIRKVVKKD